MGGWRVKVLSLLFVLKGLFLASKSLLFRRKLTFGGYRLDPSPKTQTVPNQIEYPGHLLSATHMFNTEGYIIYINPPP